jgi:hypothetical protein
MIVGTTSRLSPNEMVLLTGDRQRIQANCANRFQIAPENVPGMFFEKFCRWVRGPGCFLLRRVQ